MFDDGVKDYVHGEWLVKVNFPIDYKGRKYKCCAMCQYYSKYNNRCLLNEGVCFFPQDKIAPTCPLTFDDEEE